MPEITDAQFRDFTLYQDIGTPSEVRKKIRDLESDNQKQRDEIRETKTKLPQEGQVLLSKEDAVKYAAYKALGEPEVVKTRIQEGEDAKSRVKAGEIRTQAAAFAKAAGFADEAVDALIDIPALKDAKFEIRTKKDDKTGKDVQVPYITLAGEGQKAMALDDAREKVPALKGLKTAEPDKGGSGKGFVQQGSQQGTTQSTDRSQRLNAIRDEVQAREKASAGKQEAGAVQKTPEERLGMLRTG